MPAALRAAVFAVASVMCTGPAAADVHARLVGTWPDPTELNEIEGRSVRFPSRSPFAPTDIDVASSDDATIALGTLFLPRLSTPAPAVVILHGAAGVQHARELTYGRQFAAMGIAALVVDAFGARRDRATGFINRLMEITETMLVADAYAALRYLAGLPSVDGRRVALMGFSYGAMASVFAAYRMVAERAAPDGIRFAGHVAYYGPCLARFEDARATGAPVLMLRGTEDAIVDPKRCDEIAGDLQRGGARVSAIAYRGAYHQWDGGWDGPFKIGRNLAPCRFRVERDGVVRDVSTWLPMTGPFLRKIILGLCADSDGYLIGRDDRVREKSNRDVGRFLVGIFQR